MIRRFGSVLIAAGILLAVPALSTAQDGPVLQLRHFFAPPVQALKRVLEGDHPASVRAAPAAAKPKAPDVPATPDIATSDVPTPHVRPTPPAEAPVVEAADTNAVGAVEPVDFDQRFEPDGPPATTSAVVDVPLPKLRSAAAKPVPAATKLASLAPNGVEVPTAGACTRSLASLGIVAASAEPIRQGICGIPAPVAVSALDGGNITFSETAMVNCRMADTLATWMHDSVEPAARQYLGGDVKGIRVAASYACRTRDGIPGAKMSEHAFGNAIDIAAFNVAGVGWVEVGHSKGIAASRFLAAVRKSACGPFTTVLGPGTDGYHSEHFHLDLARRSNGSLYCK
jgi:hypothetical protein